MNDKKYAENRTAGKRALSSSENDSENKSVIDTYDYLGNSCSATDCTGLIPSAPKNKAEQDSYEELYHYQPKPPAKD